MFRGGGAPIFLQRGVPTPQLPVPAMGGTHPRPEKSACSPGLSPTSAVMMHAGFHVMHAGSQGAAQPQSRPLSSSCGLGSSWHPPPRPPGYIPSEESLLFS